MITVESNSENSPAYSPVPRLIWQWTGGAAIVLFCCSSLRHYLFQSTAFDLSWFDQGIYLISQGQPPIVSFSGFHILGDHASLIFYPISLLYKLYPSVHWLFMLQALALASGMPLVWKIGKQAGLKPSLAIAVAFAYLFYPLIFNINLFDFHPDVFVIPGVFGSVFSLREKQFLSFSICIIFVIVSKAVLSLTLIGFSLWIILFEKNRLYGYFALVISVTWFLLSTQVIFPHYTGGEHAAIGRYSYLGDSVFEVILNLVRQPKIVLGQVISLSSAEYLLLLFSPIIWGFSRSTLQFAIAILPQIVLNLLSQVGTQRDLIHQYSLPILPFLILAVITTLSQQKGWLRTRKSIIVWTLVSFICLAKPGYFWTRYLSYRSSHLATQEALQRINTSEGVLTISNIAPHLSQRSLIRQTLSGMDSSEIERYGYHYVLLNESYPGWGSDLETHQRLVTYLSNSLIFEETYHRDGVILFERRQDN